SLLADKFSSARLAVNAWGQKHSTSPTSLWGFPRASLITSLRCLVNIASRHSWQGFVFHQEVLIEQRDHQDDPCADQDGKHAPDDEGMACGPNTNHEQDQIREK